jgi:C4-dicarboxylate transporter DctQ subunit
MPVWIVYLAIPLGSYLMCFRFLQVAWSFYRTGELPQHDHARVEGLEGEVEAAQALGREETVYVGEAVSLTEEREHIHGGLPEDGRSDGKSNKGEERP